jgi:hypothetical protein
MKTKLIRLFVAVALLALPALVQAQTIVTNLADSGPGTLRQVIANAANGAVITFDPSLSGATITLSLTLAINTNLTIDASALPGGLQINGNGSVQIFNVASNTVVFLNSLAITNAYCATNFGGGIFNNWGTLTLNQCILSGNSVTSSGGGIYNKAGTLTLNQCILSGNSATGNGGCIYNRGGKLALNQCTLSGNSATHGYGGGIWNSGTLTLNECTLAGNSGAEGGGGIVNFGTLTLTNCTLSGNSGGDGGGILNAREHLTLNQCTLSGNSATNDGGGGIFNQGTLAVNNTIVAGNSGGSGADIYNYLATLTYGGSNLVQSVYVYGSGSFITGPAPFTNAPDLAPLGNYGGPTQTMPPLPGSPAIDAGLDSVTNFLATDQRGYPRLSGAHVDIGAVELQSPAANPPVLTGPARGANGAFSFTFNSASNADFTVLATTNLALPLGQWSILGEVFQNAPGQYQFTDSAATNSPQQFYRVVSP